MIFSDYLIEKKLVKQTDILQSLVQQNLSTPSLFQICFDHKLLDESQLLSVYRCQISKRCSTQIAMEHLGFWSPILEKRIKELVDDKRSSLGQILITQGKIKAEVFFTALDDYAHEKKEDTEPPKSEARNILPDLNSPMIKNFLKTVEDSGLLSLALSPESKDQISSILAEIIAGAKFVRASLTEKILKSLLNGIQKNPSKDDLYKESISLIEDLVDVLKSGSSENEFWINPEKQKKYIHNLAQWLEESN
jgi:hypothetical protein